MNINKLVLMLLGILTLFLSDCGDTGNGPESGTNVLMPLTVGNFWNLQNSSYHSANKSNVVITDTLNLKILRTEYFNNEIVTIAGINLSSNEEAFVNRLDGFWSLGSWDSAKKKIAYSIFMFKYPTKAGDIYPPATLSNEPMITDAVNITVSTPAGNFSCIKYHGSSDSTHFYYFAPGIGLVKEESITHIVNSGSTADTIWVNSLLISFKLN